MQSEQINELAAALAKAQGAMQNAVMNRTNPHFKSKYADLSSVLDAIRAPLSANGLAIVQTMQPAERFITLRTTLMHSSGQFIATEYPIPVMLKPHEMGSALTYGRRYSVAALICNSADEDDDGNEAMKGKPTNGNATNGNGARPNPHVTKPNDILPAPEYDEHGELIDNVPHAEPTQKLRVVDQRPIFEALQKELHATNTFNDALVFVNSETTVDRVKNLKDDWQEMFRGLCREHIDQLRPVPSTLMAG